MSLKNIGNFLNAGGDLAKQVSVAKSIGDVTQVADALNSISDISDLDKITILDRAFKDVNVSSAKAALGIVDAADAADDITDIASSASGKIKNLGTAFKGLGAKVKDVGKSIVSVAKAHPVAAVGVGIASAALIGKTIYDTYQQVQIDAAHEATAAWEETNTDIQSKIQEYTDLKNQLDSGTLSESETIAVKQQILDLQNQITSAYGEQAAGIDLVNGKLDTQVAKLNAIAQEEASRNLNENRSAYENAAKQMRKEQTYTLGTTGSVEGTDVGKDIYDIAKQIDGLELEDDGMGTGSYTIRFKGTAEEAEDAINSLMTDLNDLKKDYQGDDWSTGVINSILDRSEGNLTSVKDFLGKYQDDYNSYLEQSVFEEGGGSILSDLESAIQEYNNALLGSDETRIDQAADRYYAAMNAASQFVKDSGNADYQRIFDDAANSMDKASQKAHDFNEAVSGEVSGRNIFEKQSKNIKSYADQIKSAGLDIVDVQQMLEDVSDGTTSQEKAIESLASIWGITAESSAADVQSFIDALSNLGIVASDTGEAVTSSVEDIASTVQTDVQEARTALTNMTTAMEESQSASGLSTETMNSLKGSFEDLGVSDTDLNALFEATADGVKLNSDALEDLIDVQHQLRMNDITDQIIKQKDAMEDLTKGTDEYAQAQANLDSLEFAQSQYSAIYDQQKELFSDYNKWINAQSTANAGDQYVSMLNNLESAQEAFNQGLTGTDDFKTFAALLSPTGSDDAVNFAENIGKATRYITEDKSGINNFLSDLSTKTNEAGEALASFDEASQRWKFNITDMYDAAQQMGIGEDMMTAIFGRARDYGIDNNFISSVEEGTQRLKELYRDYYDEIERYGELTKEGSLYETDKGMTDANQSAIDASEKKQADLLQNISETRANMSKVAEQIANEETADFNAAKATINAMNEAKKEVLENSSLGEEDKLGIVSGIEKDIQAMADEYGIDLEADLSIAPTEFEKEYQQRIKDLENASIENPVAREFGEDTEAAERYASVQQKVQDAHKQNNEVLLQSLDTLKEYSELDLAGLNLNDGVYDSEQLKPAEQALDSLQKEFGLTAEEASQLVNVLADMGVLKIDTEFDTSSLDEGIESIKSNDELSGLTEKIDIEADVITMGMDELQNRLDVLEEYRPQIEAEFGVDSTELDAYDQLIENTKLQIKVQTVLEDTGTTVEELKGMTKDELVKVGFEPGDTSKIQAYLQSLNGETAEIPMTVKIDESQFSLLTNLTNETAEVNVVPKNPEIEVTVKDATVKVTPKPNPIEVTTKETTVPVKAEPNPIPVGVVPEEGNSLIATLNLGNNNQNVTASATVSGTEDVANLKAQIDTLYDRVVTEEAEVIGTDDVIALKAAIDSLYSKTVTATALTSGILSVQSLAAAIDSLSSKTVTVTTNYVTTGSPGGGRASGTLSSPTVVPAHAAGTAYNVINYKNAYKDGKVTLDKDEEALVNELGTESIIRDGKWMLIPGGMHIHSLKKDDIILNAQQTEDLLKHGKTNGHARAYAEGTLSNKVIPIAPAHADGTDITAEVDKLWDVFDRLVTKLEDRVELYEKRSDNAYSLSGKNRYIDKALKANAELLESYQEAFKKYQNQADLVAKDLGISNDLRQKVENGSVSFEKLSDEDRQRVDAYAEWYLSCHFIWKQILTNLSNTGNPLEPYKLQRRDEICSCVNV